MSVVSNRHTIVPFIAGKSQAMENQRLAKIGFKGRKGKPAKFKSVCVSVPQISVPSDADKVERLIPYIQSMLENAQDGIIRSLYESSEGALATVADDEIGFDACVNFMESEASGARLTKEFLVSWFNENVSENLYVVIAERLGFTEINDDVEKTIQQHLNVYRDLISSLSGNKTWYEPKQIVAAKRALEVASVDDDVSVKLGNVLKRMENRPAIADLLAL